MGAQTLSNARLSSDRPLFTVIFPEDISEAFDPKTSAPDFGYAQPAVITELTFRLSTFEAGKLQAVRDAIFEDWGITIPDDQHNTLECLRWLQAFHQYCWRQWIGYCGQWDPQHGAPSLDTPLSNLLALVRSVWGR